MKAKTFQINWHEKLPIFSVDFDPKYESSASKTTEAIGNPQQYTPQQNENGINKDIDKLNASVNASGIIDSNTNDFLYRFATGGGDCNVRIWNVLMDSSGPKIDFRANLSRHTSPVNCVKFSPNGSILASAGDDGSIVLWKQWDSNKTNENSTVGSYTAGTANILGEPGMVTDPPRDGSGNDSKNNANSSTTSVLEANDGGILYDDITGIQGPEVWKPITILRGSLADIYDLAWSPDGNYIISGSIDNTARVWDVKMSKCIQVLTDHRHYVQGVAWDPLGYFVATQSCDRSVQLYKWVKNKKKQKYHMVKVGTLNKFESCESNSNQKSTDVQQSASGPSDESSLPINTNDREAKGDIGTNGTGCPNKSKPDGPTCNSTSFKLFHDDNLNSFFRRLSFSPDGSMLYVPTGVYKEKITNADGRTIKVPPTETVYCWSREALLGNPDFHFPGHKKPTVATSVCPVKFKIDDRGDGNGNDNDNENEYGDTSKYFSIVAVASQNAVVIYGLDTPSTEYIQNSSDQLLPPVKKSSAIAYLGGLHYGTLTDLSWSPNGQCLILVSTDGFATVVTFDLNELGTPTPYALASPVKNTALPKSVSEISEDSVVNVLSPNFSSLQIHESLSDDEFVVVDDDIMAEKYCTEEKAQTVDLPDTDADTAALLKVSTGTETHSVSPMAIPIKTSKSKESAANLEGTAPSKKKRRIAPTLVSTHF